MVVGTDIEDRMVVAIVPTNQLVIFLDKREERRPTLLLSLTFGHLCQEPRTGDHCVGFEEFQRSRCRHLAGNDTREITLYGQLVDSHNLIGLDHQTECATEHLCLLAFPMEINTNSDIMQ